MTGRIIRTTPKAIQLPRIGFIKTGYKDERGIPRSTDYFIATGLYKSHFQQVYGEKPQKLEVVFYTDDADHACNERYEYRDSQGRVYARGDGKEFEVWNKDHYDIFNMDANPDLMDRIAGKIESKNGWQVVLTLRFLLPKVNGIVGYWEYTTRAEKTSINHIRDSYDAMLANRGFVKGIIFDLTVETAKSSKPDTKSRYPVVQLVANMSEANIESVRRSLFEVKPPVQLLGE